MGKSIAGVLMKDSNQDYFVSLMDPATGTTYAPRAANLHTSANGDYADPTAVLYGPDGNALLPAAVTLTDTIALPNTTILGAANLLFDNTNGWWRARSSRSIGATASSPTSESGVSLPGASSWRWNGGSYDAACNNQQGTLLANATRTATTISATQANTDKTGVMVFLRVTAASGTGGLQVGIQAIDPISADACTLHPLPTAITSNGTYAYELRPGASTVGGAGSFNLVSAWSGSIPRTWNVVVVHGNASSYTYSLSYSLLN